LKENNKRKEKEILRCEIREQGMNKLEDSDGWG
jgi:hypothetical protein